MVTARCWVACICATTFLLPTFSAARGIKELSIIKIGRSLESDDVSVQQCKLFRPTLNQVRQYFIKAYPVPRVVTADTYYSPCYAEGNIKFTDDLSGTWRLYSSGAAGLTWALGGGVNLLYRRNDWKDPFGGYDIR